MTSILLATSIWWKMLDQDVKLMRMNHLTLRCCEIKCSNQNTGLLRMDLAPQSQVMADQNKEKLIEQRSQDITRPYTNVTCTQPRSREMKSHEWLWPFVWSCATGQNYRMTRTLYLVAVLCAVFTVGEFAGILSKFFIQEPIVFKGEADPGKPLFLTPYIMKKDYRLGAYCSLPWLYGWSTTLTQWSRIWCDILYSATWPTRTWHITITV